MDYFFFFFFKQKTAYEIVSGDWSSDVCSSDLTSCACASSSRASASTRWSTTAARCASSRKSRAASCEGGQGSEAARYHARRRERRAACAEAEAVSALPSARHPTLNTKPLFKLMVEKKASDLFFTSNAPIKIKIEGQILPVNKQVLAPDTVRQTAFALMSPERSEERRVGKECLTQCRSRWSPYH